MSVLAKFHLPPVLPGFVPRFNIAPSQEQWTIRLDDSGRPAPGQLKWGLVPSWASDPSVGQRMVNARADSVAGKPSYKESFKRRRCLILADGYYEWSGSGRYRMPMFFHLAGHRDFAMAGLWDRWEQSGEPLDTCTIITTNASAKAAQYHHRMPALLTLDGAKEWLDPALSEPRLLELLVPYESPDLKCYEVSKLVNAPANDSESCIVPAEPTELTGELSLWDT